MGDEDKEGKRRSNISSSSSSSSSRAMENLSLKMENYPRDLLQRFMSSSSDAQQSQHAEHHQEQEESEDEIELNLGLSLGGRFGIDKHANKLMRSSSIVGTMPLVREDESMTPPPATYPTLLRTSSLPTETEEEWRKRKELQTLRRMEAKRRRSEKQRIFKTEREGGGGVLDEEKREVMESAAMALNRFGSSTVAPPFGLPSWAASTRQLVLGDVLAKGKVGGAGFRGFLGQPSSQGSVDNSQGGSSLGMSEMDSKPFLGSGSFGEARSPASVQSLQEQSSLDAAGGSSGTRTNEDMRRNNRADQVENPSRRSHPSQNIGREIGANSMEDMPCVFTKGDGPNGRRIEGILYKYGKGEEVRIMCVCHGNFLSPAEFVKHAGGGDVAHPLRHIVVDLSATPFLC